MTIEPKDYAYHLHDIVCNQKYDGLYPYSLHLNAVHAQARKWGYLLEPDFTQKRGKGENSNIDRWLAEAGAVLHDAIEDARVTYNELKDLFGVEVAEVVWACTEDAGRSRDERHGPAYFSRLRNNHVGVFVKLCDIMANSLYGAMTNSSMFRKQAKEWPHFKEETTEHHERFKPMYEFLNKLYEIN